MKVLGVETSCDETAAAVVRDGREILSNVVSSQVVLHRPYGGVVPELASRNHLRLISSVIEEALAEARTSVEQIDAIAATYGPGLGLVVADWPEHRQRHRFRDWKTVHRHQPC